MIRVTAERLLKKIPADDIFVVAPIDQKSLIKEHLPFIEDGNIILEPFGMNTAPCIALAVKYLKKKYSKDEKLLVLPADHLIREEDAVIAFVYHKQRS